MIKPFTFSLERMREYKNQVLEAEKNLLQALNKRLLDIEEKILHCKNFRQEKQDEMRQKQEQGSTMRELDECKFYLENTRMQIEALEEERVAAMLEVERQRKVVIGASQEVSSLDKLEEKQMDDYRYLEARDSEKEIQEHVIHRLVYSHDGLQAD